MLAASLQVWEEAMTACFHFELVVRLLVQTRLAKESIERDLGGGNGLLALMFREWDFTKEEQDFLPKCTKLRNKLIHCEPDALYHAVQELDPTFVAPRVVKSLRLPETEGGLLDLALSRRDAVDVRDTTTREEGFSGWMLEAAGNGAFVKATSLLRRGASIVRSKQR